VSRHDCLEVARFARAHADDAHRARWRGIERVGNALLDEDEPPCKPTVGVVVLGVPIDPATHAPIVTFGREPLPVRFPA
jgi:hypothetical protein